MPGQRQYRAAWHVQQEDGTRVALYSVAFHRESEARNELDRLADLPYVVDAWVEASEWVRVPDGR